MKEQQKIGIMEQHERDMERIQELCMMDDVFMSKVLENPECTELVLRIILQKTIHVLSARSQYEIKNLYGRSVRLDVWSEDETGQLYNVEVQRSDKGAVPKRARYNSSLMDANVTEPGEKYEKLAETYVIFITENDIPGEGKPLYHIDRYYQETGKQFMDGAHIIYVNSQIKDDTELGRLMQDFYCKVPEEMHYKELAKAAGYLKRSEKGVQSMGGVLDEMREEVAAAAREFGRKEGREEGRDQTLIALICRKLKKQKGIATIAEELEEDIETVENICKVAEKFAPEYDVEQIYEELHTVAV